MKKQKIKNEGLEKYLKKVDAMSMEQLKEELMGVETRIVNTKTLRYASKISSNPKMKYINELIKNKKEEK